MTGPKYEKYIAASSTIAVSYIHKNFIFYVGYKYVIKKLETHKYMKYIAASPTTICQLYAAPRLDDSFTKSMRAYFYDRGKIFPLIFYMPYST